jgi:hypothetical protein
VLRPGMRRRPNGADEMEAEITELNALAYRIGSPTRAGYGRGGRWPCGP